MGVTAAAQSGTASRTTPGEAAWPYPKGKRLVFLLDACSSLERRYLEDWIARNAPSTEPGLVRVIPVLSTRTNNNPRQIDPRLEQVLSTNEDPLMAPLRVAWLGGDSNGTGESVGKGLLSLRNPHNPGKLRQNWLLKRHPERCRVVVADPAPASELRSRWRRAGGTDFAATTGLAEFVVRQAGLALERAERRLRGTRYKVPRFVNEEILSRSSFKGGLAKLTWELGRTEAEVSHEAIEYLDEIAATHSTYVIDIAAQLIRLLYTRGYGEQLHYDRAELEKVYEVAQRYPVVFLPSHKSNLDHLVLQYALHENGHPPNHTAGGINMNFFPIGPIVRRSGVFFIRRSFKDNPVYKYVLQAYIDYLIEKRFPLEWYLEGGRSRSGKLLPPRFGLLANVVDAYRRGRSEDVVLIPVSISYDQIQDIGEYVAEQRGAAKEAESLSWFIKMVRRFHKKFGDIHISFGEPLSLRDQLGEQNPDAEPNPDEQNIGVQKTAFEVMVRINNSTPITPTSLLTIALLGKGDRALTLEEIAGPVDKLGAYVRKRGLPTTGIDELQTREGIEQNLQRLIDNGVVSVFSEGPEAVYAIVPDQHLAAAFYRNTIIHYFVNGSIVELALLRAMENDVKDAQEGFWSEIMNLRDLLKFEFFFSDKDTFVEEIREELGVHDPDWPTKLKGGRDDLRDLLGEIRPWNSHRVLRPFFEAYQVVGDALETLDTDKPFDEGAFLNSCLALGKQYHLQRRIRSAESVSKVLFSTALDLAKNRELLEGGDDLLKRRQDFGEEIRRATRRIDGIDALVASRRARLID